MFDDEGGAAWGVAVLPEDGGEEEAHVGFFEAFVFAVGFGADGHAVGEFAGGVEVEGVEL